MTWNAFYAMMLLAAAPTVSAVVQLSIISTVGAGMQTQVRWSREPGDPQTWDFIIDGGSGPSDVAAVLQAGDNTAGLISLVFPSAGLFTLSAVDPTNNNELLASISGIQVGEIPTMPGSTLSYYPPSGTTSPSDAPPTSTDTNTFTTISPWSSASSPSLPASPTAPSPPFPTNPVSTSVTSTTPLSKTSTSPNQSSIPTATPSSAAAVRASSKTPAIVGGVLGSVAFLAIVAVLAVVLYRRRQRAVRRITFHRELMVQRRSDLLLQKDYDVERNLAL